MAEIDYSQITNQQKLIIDEVIDTFEFEKVHEHMVNTNWKWATGDYNYYEVPSIISLKQHLRRMLVDAYTSMNNRPELKEMPYMLSCGGFTIFLWWPNDECRIFFSVTELDIDSEYIECLGFLDD